MSWNIKTPGDYINGPLTVDGITRINNNVGIGLAPSAWDTTSTTKTLEIGYKGNAVRGAGASDMTITSNCFFNSGVWKYAETAFASRYNQGDGNHRWYTAPSGTAGNTITFTQAMLLDTNGNLIVGGAFSQAPSATTIYNDGTINSILSSGAGGTTLISAISGVSNGFQISVTAANEQTYTWFNGGTPSMKLDSLGNLLVGPTSANANGGCLQLRSGITFPATQVASTDANTLDDYEEGLWTPVVADAATGGNVGTYVNNGSTYTKIGNQVTVQTYISSINTTGLTGTNAIVIRGLPFAAVRGGQGSFYTYRVGRNALTVSSSAFVSGGTSHIAFNLFGTNSATTDLRILVSDITSGTSEFILTVTYFV